MKRTAVRIMKGPKGAGGRLARLRGSLTYANVVSSLCLFLVLGGGTAYATHLVVNGSDVVDESLTNFDIANESLRSEDIENRGILGVDIVRFGLNSDHIAADTLTGWNIDDDTLTGDDVADASLTGADIRDGTIREAEVAGGVMRGWERRTNTFTVSALSTGTTTAFCPAGKRVLGGGFSQPSYDVLVTDSAPNSNNSGWQVFARNEGALSRILTVYAFCANVS